ncbi:hypothetical protein ABE237_00950 [Brevibacillus formosus]|uniref:hypothetical protein n=1 Tax=Brevibacillus formosus TaxID=54913 RepID=UPI0018CDC2A9|nr:hypothetical protein [Brevibacillus formosus]MBG9944712.1 hypothetical protein [Brevibacillus formosus]
MARTEVIKFRDFMDGTWNMPKPKKRDLKKLTDALIKTGAMVPLVLAPALHASAAESIPAAATQVVAGATLQVLAHALDPLTQILVAISLPVASVVMIGGCFFFMFGQSERAWSTIQNSGLGYLLIQLSPLFIKVLEQIGKSI